MNISSFLSGTLHRLLCFPFECTRPSEKNGKQRPVSGFLVSLCPL